MVDGWQEGADAVQLCGELCARHIDQGCNFFYIVRRTGRDRGAIIGPIFGVSVAYFDKITPVWTQSTEVPQKLSQLWLKCGAGNDSYEGRCCLKESYVTAGSIMVRIVVDFDSTHTAKKLELIILYGHSSS